MFAFVMFHIFSEAVLQTHSQLRLWQQQQRTLTEQDRDRLHQQPSGSGVHPTTKNGGTFELSPTIANGSNRIADFPCVFGAVWLSAQSD